MKTISTSARLAILAIAVSSVLFVSAQDKPKLKDPLVFAEADLLRDFAIIPAISSAICFSTDKGNIEINCRTGEVTLAKGNTLPEAAKGFWLAVARAFPEARRQIIEGQPTAHIPVIVETGKKDTP